MRWRIAAIALLAALVGFGVGAAVFASSGSTPGAPVASWRTGYTVGVLHYVKAGSPNAAAQCALLWTLLDQHGNYANYTKGDKSLWIAACQLGITGR